MPNRKIVSRSEHIASACDTIDPFRLIEMFNQKKKELDQDLHVHIKFELNEYGYPYDPASYTGLFIVWKDYESADEMKARIDQERQYQEDRIKRDRAEFERLRQQFGN